MKIKRVVNGQEMEFELTNREVIEVFWEQEECNMKEDMNQVLEDGFDDDVMLSEKEIDQTLQLYKKYRSNSDEWRYDMEEAINVVLNGRG